MKTSPILVPVLVFVNGVLWLTDTLAMWISAQSSTVAKPSLIVLKLDSMGDYLMVRPYLRYLKQHPTYQHYSFILVGNQAFRQMAEGIDNDLFEHFIWLDIYRFSTNILYRFRTIRLLRDQGATVTLSPTYSRVLVLDDFLTRAIGAPTRIGCQPDLTNIANWEVRWGNQYYNRLLPTQADIVFEAERNRQIFSNILQQHVLLLPLTIPAPFNVPAYIPERFIVIAPGAGAVNRIWPIDRLAAIIEWLSSASSTTSFVITGTATEKYLLDELEKNLTISVSIIDTMGKISQVDLVSIVAKAVFVIANDSGVVHIAACTNTPCIALSAGKSLIRWHPYPPEISTVIHHVYPREISLTEENTQSLANSMAIESPIPMAAIDIDLVKSAINLLWLSGQERA